MFTPGGQLDRLSFAGMRGGGKGGGGGAPNYTPPSPIVLTDPVTGRAYTQAVDAYGQPQGVSAQDQLNAGIAEREATAKTASEAAAKKKTDDEAAALGKFNTSKQTAYNNALADTMQQFTAKGIDPTPYLETQIKPMLNRKMSTIKDLDPNPAAAFGSDLGASIINDLTGTKRTSASDQLNTIFNPTYSQTAIPDTLTGGYADTLLNEQFNPLGEQLKNAQKRGTLTDVGYNAALGKLGEKRSAATSTIGDLGKTIIGKDRSEIDDYIGNARKDANALSLSSMFDPNTYRSGAQNLVNTDVSNFGGALRSAVGGTQFANLGELINAGGAVQGATNPNAANPLGVAPLTAAALADQDPLKKRGLGSTGAF
jgi:hypothetical protein